MPDGGNTTHDLLVGEISTGLLRHSHAISSALAEQLLSIVLGERPRTSERPIAHVLSPDRLTGVDCQLPRGTESGIRAVGTVTSRVSITGGHAAQGSAFTGVRLGSSGRRLPWSYYLASPGVVETIGKASAVSLVDGFVRGRSEPGSLDLEAISERALDQVQLSAGLDHDPPMKAKRTRLRWLCCDNASGSDPMRLIFGPGQTRTVLVSRKDGAPARLAEFFEDLALHDWLLTTLLTVVARSRMGTGAARRLVVAQLKPALDHLLHLWMPAARIESSLVPLWEAMERRPGLTRQWQSTVNRLRDQLALAALATHSLAAGEPDR